MINLFNRESLIVFRVSYIWYTMIGAFVTVSISLIATLVTSENTEKLDPMLLAPFVRKYFKTSSRAEKLHPIEVTFCYFYPILL